MTDRLHTLLDEAAVGARDYADADAVLAAANRIRVRRRLVATSLVAAAAVIAVVTAPLLERDDGPGPTPGGSPLVITPPGLARPLPATPVGAASLVYAPCVRDCDPFLVFSDGTQYVLPRARQGQPTAGYTLSPDGRWLGRTTTTDFRLRDLTGTTTYTIPGDGSGITEAWAWSPDSNRLLLARHTDGHVSHFDVLDVDTRKSRGVSAAGRTPLAVGNDGKVLYWKPDARTLVVEDLSAGSVRTLIPERRSLLRRGEKVRLDSLRLAPDGRLAALTVTRPVAADDLGLPTALVLISLADGQAIGRLDLPVSGWTVDAGIWEPRALLPDGVLLFRTTPERTEVVRLTTRKTVLFRLPRDSQAVLRGTSR